MAASGGAKFRWGKYHYHVGNRDLGIEDRERNGPIGGEQWIRG